VTVFGQNGTPHVDSFVDKPDEDLRHVCHGTLRQDSARSGHQIERGDMAGPDGSEVAVI
jgi:hypothetical protein